MASTISTPASNLHKISYNEFSSSFNELYNEPFVTDRIGQSAEFKLPKELLCKQSPYFAGTFNGSFKEATAQVTIMEEDEGVVSVRSFKMLWLYRGRIGFGTLENEEAISAAIELARLADMFSINKVSFVMAKKIRSAILANMHPHEAADWSTRVQDILMRTPSISQSITLIPAAELPEGHPVRMVISQAMVNESFRSSRGIQPTFMEKIINLPSFSADVRLAVRGTLATVREAKFIEPISKRKAELKPFPY